MEFGRDFVTILYNNNLTCKSLIAFDSLISNFISITVINLIFSSLTCFFLQDGDRGYLEGLASRYADLFSTHYGDVLAHLEDLRKTEVAESMSRNQPSITHQDNLNVNGTNVGQGMTTSVSQPLYVPGKYLVS